MSRTGRTRSEPDRRHHRQPEREKRRKRGAYIDPHGYDAGKKIKGKKRHILVDTLGLLLHAIVHPADIRIATEAFSSWRHCSACFHFWRRCSSTADIKDRNLRKGLQRCCRISTLKSSSVPI